MKQEKFETRAIRTQTDTTPQREHSAPLYLTSSFTFESAEHGAAMFSGEQAGNLYSRFTNPNTDEFVAKLCQMEQCETGVATSTGMAAVYTAFVAHLEQGDHIVAADAIFGNSRHILKKILPKMGVTCTLVDVTHNEAWEEAIQPCTKLLYVESPSNPTLRIANLGFLGDLARAHDLIYIVDNCFATPYLQQPAHFGADLVVHSATKYIDGQGRVMGGAILGHADVVGECYDFLRRTGASMSPFNAWVLSKSLETLAVRMERHCQNAQKLVEWLQGSKEVSGIFYPFVGGDEQEDLARRQMRSGGGLVGCELAGGLARGRRFLNALKMHSLTANLGDTRSIATHPASTTHAKLSEEDRLAVGITPGFIRFSVGLEHIDDIIADVEQAMDISK